MKVLILILIFPFYLIGQSSEAQLLPMRGKNEQCLTSKKHEKLMLQDDSYRQAYLTNKRKSSNSQLENNFVIPIVIHVLHLGEEIGVGTNISDEQIYSAIDRINEQYGSANSTGLNTNISFCLATKNPQGEFTNGINRIDASNVSDYSVNGITNDNGSSNNELLIKSISNWPNLDYYNVWVVSEIDGNDGGSGTQGYAYYASAGSYENGFDGAVILYNSFGYDPNSDLGYNLKSYTNLNVTFAHEMGHAFNLKHTFEGDEGGSSCPSNINCFTNGDEVCDTDPHTREDGNCGDSGETCFGVGTDLSEVVSNIMSYSSQSCKTKFTNGQIERMANGIMDYRFTLLESDVCEIIVNGCTDTTACNYIADANNDDGSCEYTDGICESCEDGIIIDNDSDNDGICDDDEIETFNCINESCIDLGDNMGTYTSLSDCEQSCTLASINENEKNTFIYPNPSSGIFNLNIAAKSNTILYITNIFGVTIYENILKNSGNHKVELDLSNLSKGIYSLTIISETEINNYKLILN